MSETWRRDKKQYELRPDVPAIERFVASWKAPKPKGPATRKSLAGKRKERNDRLRGAGLTGMGHYKD